MAEPVIHLLFKTHLDIGFTDHAEKVRKLYHDRFIPQAIETGEHFYGEDPNHPMFIWTTGAWLIWDHLEHAGAVKAARLERAIERGLIRWHALPFTTHSELMSPALFEAGISYSQELDRRFNKTTIAAKMTDVPGHTRGIVPLLAKAGVKFLHLGVNEASPVPDVPEIFRWRAPGGEEIVVMYEDSYGKTHFPSGVGAGLSFAHTQDNAGPQSVSTTMDNYRHLEAAYPGSEIRASTLDEYAAIAWEKRQSFPVVETEIGDSWIFGVATDPTKVAQFLALQRLYDGYAKELAPERLSFGRRLAMVPEHTWGVDIKTYLRDRKAWDRPAFEAARKTDPRFAFTEASWTEQRRYLEIAIDALGDNDSQDAETARVSALPAALAHGNGVEAGDAHKVGGWTVEVNPVTGDIARLVAPSGVVLTGAEGSLLGYRYESYTAADIDLHLDTYLSQRPEWAYFDHAKPGLETATTAKSATWAPKLEKVLVEAQDLTIVASMPEEATSRLGAPRRIEISLRPHGTSVEIAVSLYGKPANRMPEASFVPFTPMGASAWEFLKMGLWQDATKVAPKGGGQLQAVFGVRAAMANEAIAMTPLDTPLVAPSDTHFMAFNKLPPSFGKGIRFNLHNNKWGTNFPMWWGGDFTARFNLTVDAKQMTD